MARQISGDVVAAAEAGQHRNGFQNPFHLQRNPDRHCAARRQHRPCRRANPVQQRNHPQPVALEPHPRRGCLRHEHDRRSRRHARRRSGRGGENGSPLSTQHRLGRFRHHRRQCLHQCRRRTCPALWQYPRSGSRRRSSSRRRPCAGHAAHPAQGQHGLRPQAPFHWRGRNPRHRHRGGTEALSATGRARHGADRCARSAGRRQSAVVPASRDRWRNVGFRADAAAGVGIRSCAYSADSRPAREAFALVCAGGSERRREQPSRRRAGKRLVLVRPCHRCGNRPKRHPARCTLETARRHV